MLLKIALGNVRKSVRDFSVFFLTLVFGVCVFYAFGSITEQTAVIELSQSQSESLHAVMGIFSGVSVFIAVVLGFLVVYANRFLVRRRKREFGIYLTLGMGRGQVSRIMVVETLAVGLVALAAGLALGVLLSQLMMYVTAHLFQAHIDGFAFVFSPRAAIETVACFAAIFLVSLVFNVVAVSRYRLIDLIRADKVSEEVKVRSLPLSVALFVASVALIGAAYRVLLKNGIMSDQFGLATALVTVGTALFFFSISGFLLRFIQSRPALYLRGLNAFVLRQLNSRVNTAWVSITLVCAMLFLAICGVCTGLSVSTSMNDALEKGSPYDASLRAYPMGVTGIFEADGEDGGDGPEASPAAVADGFDMLAALRREIPEWDDLVSDAAQVSAYTFRVAEGGLLQKWAFETTDYHGNALFDQAMDGGHVLFSFVKLSDYNALRAFLGKDPVMLGTGECLVWNDLSSLDGFWDAFIEQHPTVSALGAELHPAGRVDETLYNSSGGSVTGAIVVPDELIPAGAVPISCSLDVSYAGPRDQVEQRFWDATEKALGASYARSSDSWPACFVETGQNMADATVGLTVVVAYLAIYIGFVLLITCASVLAIQQLSEAADNVARYRVLADLGTEPAQVRRALMAQIGVYFAFPLVVAVCHAACALTAVNDVVSLLTGYDIGSALVATVCFVVLLYGGYFLVTYETSKGIVLREP